SADNNGAVSVFEASQALLSGGDCPSPIEASGCPNSVEELSDQKRISIAPNPFQSEFVLDVEPPFTSNTIITVYSITGQVLFRKIFEQGEHIAVSGLDFLDSGIYIIR
ncbi:T9SS type A sorting domain-containing protein, partial [Arthrospira platensis SPKY1]|nr:T9SS type A sorting domain-containing protein [Arthrospira platensis SPKY1]